MVCHSRMVNRALEATDLRDQFTNTVPEAASTHHDRRIPSMSSLPPELTGPVEHLRANDGVIGRWCKQWRVDVGNHGGGACPHDRAATLVSRWMFDRWPMSVVE